MACTFADLTLLLAGCAADDAIPADATPWCRPLTLAAITGTPGERVAIAGLPEGQATVYARVAVPGSEIEGQAVVLASESGDDLIVPLHPVETLA